MSRKKNLRRGRRRSAPEVIQTSNMDCGPACLASVLEGFGLPVHLGRLREACQTDVDGTSIDTVETVARELGLDAHQVLVPIEQLADSPERMLPAVVIVRLSNGANHFVVVWRRFGPWLQVMDPGTGRRWVRARRFLDELYEHSVLADSEQWREWASGEAFTEPLSVKLRALGFGKAAVQALIDKACADPSWKGLARLDAAERATRSIVRAGGARVGRESRAILEALLEESERARAGPPTIPDSAWSVRLDAASSEGADVLRLRGAVLVRFEGCLDEEAEAAPAAGRLSATLKAALGESQPNPWRAMWEAAREEGWLAPGVLALASVLAGALVLVQALTWRALVDLQQVLVLPEQRLGALAVILALLALTLAVDLPLLSGVLRLGRHLEARLRVAFQGKLPRLSDRYFQSRPISDMTERAHNIHFVRRLPALAGQLARLGFQLIFTTAALVWIAPGSAVLAIVLALVSLVLPFVTQAWIVERELRTRSLNGSLARFHLDALIGLVPIHTHGAERGLRREHEHLLTRWYRASFGLRNALVMLESLQLVVTTSLAAWLVVAHLSLGTQATSTLLLCYWALTLPSLGREFSSLWLSLPALRNATLRLLEPLGALEVEETPPSAEEPRKTSDHPTAGVAFEHLPGIESGLRAAGRQASSLAGEPAPRPRVIKPREFPAAVALSLSDVHVRAGGHRLLSEIDLNIAAGEHVAILGPSGAGKSTLLALFLGWHEASQGKVLVDGRSLRGEALTELRRRIAWVDPGVQLWNRSMLDNLRYGTPELDANALGEVLEQADLLSVLEGLPDGLDESLGEGGGLLSGGEGQRTRLGRALLRREVQLVLLDEPFRGIDRERRRELLKRTRERFAGATLLCVTHDVAETRDFDRVIGIEGGRVVADGAPRELEALADSPYRHWLEAEQHVRREIWEAPEWERWTLADGRLHVKEARS